MDLLPTPAHLQDDLVMSLRLSIVVPCYNEQEVLPETNRRLLALLDRMQVSGLVAEGSGIHYVDDGSRDSTWLIVEGLAAADPRVHGLKLSRNRGHQMALLAGLLTVAGDALVSIDAEPEEGVPSAADSAAGTAAQSAALSAGQGEGQGAGQSADENSPETNA